MTIHNPSDDALKRALATLGATALMAGIISLLDKTTKPQKNHTISEDDLALLQIIIMREAAKDIKLDFPHSKDASLTDFRKQLKLAIIKKVEGGEETLRELVCVKLNYCERVGSNWRGKIGFAAGLTICAFIVDVTGLTLASTLFLLSIGYFDKLCKCSKVPAANS